MKTQSKINVSKVMKITKDPISLNAKEFIQKQKIKPLVHRKEYKKTSIQYYKEWFKYKFYKRRLFLVIMKLRQGGYKTFTTSTIGRHFLFDNGFYFLDQDMTDRDYGTGFNLLFYHQDCAIPFKIDFNIDELMEYIKSKSDKNDNSIVKAVNPSSFRAFMDSEIIEKILKGQELSDQLKKMYMVIIAIAIISVINTILIAKSQGWI